MDKIKNIPKNIKQSISSSYIAFGKKYGFIGPDWLNLCLNEHTNSKRRASRNNWISKNLDLACEYVNTITAKYEQANGWNTYQEYLNSGIWKQQKAKFLSNDSKCARCGRTTKLVLHHLRYKDENGKSVLGRETKDDLVVLCWDCHNELHKKYGRGASFGLEEISQKEEWYVVLLKSDKKLWVNENAFQACKEALRKEESYIFLRDAILVASEIEIILEESIFRENEDAIDTKEETL